MAMETLTRPRHVKVGVRIYAAQFFDYVTGEVLPGPSLVFLGPGRPTGHRQSPHATGHWRAINPGVVGFITVTSGAPAAQVRAVRGLDRSDSQADSAGSIPVTRSR